MNNPHHRRCALTPAVPSWLMAATTASGLLSLLGIAAVDFLPIVSAAPHYIWNLYFFDSEGEAKPIHKTFNLVLGDIRRSFLLVLHPGPAFSTFAFEPKTNFMIAASQGKMAKNQLASVASVAVVTIDGGYDERHGQGAKRGKAATVNGGERSCSFT